MAYNTGLVAFVKLVCLGTEARAEKAKERADRPRLLVFPCFLSSPAPNSRPLTPAGQGGNAGGGSGEVRHGSLDDLTDGIIDYKVSSSSSDPKEKRRRSSGGETSEFVGAGS